MSTYIKGGVCVCFIETFSREIKSLKQYFGFVLLFAKWKHANELYSSNHRVSRFGNTKM